MRHEHDDEVDADLELRTASERRDATPIAYGRGRVTGHVPCRARCGRLADWTDEAEAAFRAFSAALEARGEAPLDATQAVFCDACRTRGRSMAADANRQRVDDLAAKIRELKASRSPENERVLIASIRAAGHPDVEGLLEAIRAKRSRSSSGKAWRDDV